MNYGIELEFFVTNLKDQIVPAFKVTDNLDGNPIIGEIRTGIHPTMVDCIFELRKLLHVEQKKIDKKDHRISLHSNVTLPEGFLKALRSNERYMEQFQKKTALLEKSIYGKETGKELPSNELKASLQINMSEQCSFTYHTGETKTRDYCGKKMKEKIFQTQEFGEIFDYITPIMSLDEYFSIEIKQADRVKGVYAIKRGEKGKRIEYRSLPNTVVFENLLDWEEEFENL